MGCHHRPEFCHFGNDDIGKRIFDTAVEHFTSCRHDAIADVPEGDDLHQWLGTGCLFCRLHLFFFNDQRNDPRPGQTVSFSDGKSAMPGGNHHLTQGIDPVQALRIDEKQTVTVRRQFYFAFLRFSSRNMTALTDIPQDDCRVIFMEHMFIIFPDINLFFSHRQQNGNVFRLDNMPLAEDGTLAHATDDLCNIMTEHLPDGIDGTHFFHRFCTPFFF